jgi:hypothetical protein
MNIEVQKYGEDLYQKLLAIDEEDNIFFVFRLLISTQQILELHSGGELADSVALRCLGRLSEEAIDAELFESV